MDYRKANANPVLSVFPRALALGHNAIGGFFSFLFTITCEMLLICLVGIGRKRQAVLPVYAPPVDLDLKKWKHPVVTTQHIKRPPSGRKENEGKRETATKEDWMRERINCLWTWVKMGGEELEQKWREAEEISKEQENAGTAEECSSRQNIGEETEQKWCKSEEIGEAQDRRSFEETCFTIKKEEEFASRQYESSKKRLCLRRSERIRKMQKEKNIKRESQEKAGSSNSSKKRRREPNAPVRRSKRIAERVVLSRPKS